MLGVIVYLSTTFAFSPVLNLLLPFFFIIRLWLSGTKGYVISRYHKLSIVSMLIATILSVIVFVLFDAKVVNMEKSIIGEFPYVALLFVSLLTGFLFKKRDIQIIAIFIVIEILVGLLEYYYGVSSFFIANRGETSFGETNLLYYNRVYGLSLNSSVFAFKVLLLYVIFTLGFFRDFQKYHVLLISLIVVGLLITFSRTTIMSIMISFLIVNCKRLFVNRYFFLFVILVLFSGVYYHEELINQFFRGKSQDMSGRDFVFNYYIGFILDNPIIGNSGSKLWFEYGEKLFHAHNSYLQLLSSNGFLISIFVFLSYGFLLKFKGAALFLPIFIYSLFQYGFGWGFVFHDIVVFSLLITYVNIRSENAKVDI